MRTLDEVIKILEDCEVRGGFFDWKYGISDALHYLKEYRKLDSLDVVAFPEDDNPAMTWDELKSMEGKPVWVEYNFQIDDKEFRDKSKRWCIVREFKPWHDTEIIITENGFVLSKREQINSWQAYRKERE